MDRVRGVGRHEPGRGVCVRPGPGPVGVTRCCRRVDVAPSTRRPGGSFRPWGAGTFLDGLVVVREHDGSMGVRPRAIRTVSGTRRSLRSTKTRSWPPASTARRSRRQCSRSRHAAGASGRPSTMPPSPTAAIQRHAMPTMVCSCAGPKVYGKLDGVVIDPLVGRLDRFALGNHSNTLNTKGLPWVTHAWKLLSPRTATWEDLPPGPTQ